MSTSTSWVACPRQTVERLIWMCREGGVPRAAGARRWAGITYRGVGVFFGLTAARGLQLLVGAADRTAGACRGEARQCPLACLVGPTDGTVV